MASVVIAGDTSGQVTLAAPAVAGTTTLTLPATTGTMLNDATVGVCRAWVNFNGTLASPITPRASFNVSSITKNGTGDYTVNFTNAMSDVNYSVTGGTRRSTGNLGDSNCVFAVVGGASYPLNTSNVRVLTAVNSVTASVNTATDFDYVSVAIFR